MQTILYASEGEDLTEAVSTGSTGGESSSASSSSSESSKLPASYKSSSGA